MPATLSTSEILTDVLDAFKVLYPQLKSFSTDFSSAGAVLNQTVIARISKVPAVAAYDPVTGYKNGATDVNTIVEDVPVTIDSHQHVPVKIGYLQSISTKRDLYSEAIKNIGFALGKAMVDSCLAKVVAANFTNQTVETTAATSRDTLSKVTLAMNIKGAALLRYGITSSAFYNKLDEDARITSGDYHGQQRSSGPYGHLTNVAGFQDIWEYPAMPAPANLSAFFYDKRAIVVATRLPADIQNIASSAGIPKIAAFETVQDPDSGLSLLGIRWMEPGTFDVYVTITILWGSKAGAQGGAAGSITDYAGHRVVTA
ncbi:MAG: hypothetical protein DMF62_03230 [Acidobacteria bacterium]|nr:MAG: hypothetical protein DMF62_03230 [Acidobacteriota bacterium]